MTARRRRKSGSGPSAPALIAWVEGHGAEAEQRSASSARTVPEFPAPQPRVSFTARGGGLAAGALLACGSMLAVAVHAADSSSSSSERDLPSGLVTASPEDVSAGYGATQLAMAQPPAAAADRAQAFADNHIRSGPVVRNTPLALDTLPVPSEVSTAPTVGAPTSEEVAQPLPRSLPDTAEDPAPESHPVEPRAEPMAQTSDQDGTRLGQLTAPVARVGAPVTQKVAQVGGLIVKTGDEDSQSGTTLSSLSRGAHSE